MHQPTMRIIINSLIGAGIGYTIPFFILMVIPYLLQTIGYSLPPESLRSFAMILVSSQVAIVSTLIGAFLGFGYAIIRRRQKNSGSR